MTVSRFYLCAIPGPFWQPASAPSKLNLGTFASDALSCERRIAKEVNLKDEQTRYNMICDRMEQELIQIGGIRWMKDFSELPQLLSSGFFPAAALSDGYLSILSRLAEQPNSDDRLGASFFPPDQVSSHLQRFAKWAQEQGLSSTRVVQQRLAFLDQAAKTGCGVMELQTTFLPASIDQAQIAQYRGSVQADAQTSAYIEVPKFEVTTLDRELFGEKGKKQHLLRILIGQMEEALRNNEPVSFGNQAPHDVITEALNHFVFVPAERPLTPANLRVAYSDGSEAEPFPVLCLHQLPESSVEPGASQLRVSLMSMRHFELDPEIDLCWFRNREVSQTRTLAETDAFCYNATLNQIEESLKQGSVYLQMFHTGFEPAVLGFYRGLVQMLLKLRTKKAPSLHVFPFYFRGGDHYQQGSRWE